MRTFIFLFGSIFGFWLAWGILLITLESAKIGCKDVAGTECELVWQPIQAELSDD